MKKKCLIVLPRLLFPQTGGYTIKTLNFVKIICNEYDVKLIVIDSEDLSKEEKRFYDEHVLEYKNFKIPQYRLIWNAILTIFSSKPMQCGYFYFKNIEKEVQNYAKDCDIAIGTLIRTGQYIDSIKTPITRVTDMIDSIGLNYQRSIKNTSSLFWKLIYKIEANRLIKYERQIVSSSDVTLYVNYDEATYWSKYGNTIWTPMAVKIFLLDYSLKDNKYSNSVAFFGKMDYRPNIEAVLWYIKNVHSKIKNAPNLIIIGANPHPIITKIAQKYNNIEVTGFIEDPYIILNSVKAVVSPMLSGGGVQNKILECMALGAVNIVSTLAATPIKGAIDGEHFYIANTMDDYERIFNNFDTIVNTEKIRVNSKEYISKTYLFSIYSDIVINSIKKVEHNLQQ